MSSKLFAFNVSKKSEKLEEVNHGWIGDNVARGCHVVGHCTSQNYGNNGCYTDPVDAICESGGGAGYYICDGYVECP